MTLPTYPDSRWLRLRPFARAALSSADYLVIAARAEALHVVLGALRGLERDEWICTAKGVDGRRTRLRAHGPLPAILLGLLDDLEELE